MLYKMYCYKYNAFITLYRCKIHYIFFNIAAIKGYNIIFKPLVSPISLLKYFYFIDFNLFKYFMSFKQ